MTRTNVDLTMSNPMLGFEALRQFRLESLTGLEPFYRLRSLEDEGVSFILLNPCSLEPGYRTVVERRLDQLGLPQDSNWYVFSVVTPAGRQGLGLNLLAPLVVYPALKSACQIVLSEPYTTCHVLPATPIMEAQAC